MLEVDVQVQVQKKKGVEEYIPCSSLTWDGIETAHPPYTQLLLPVISGYFNDVKSRDWGYRSIIG